jgi:cytoskeletal protein CcmA (bactofilin family)
VNDSSVSGLNVIYKGTRIYGDLFCDGDIRIDGQVKGSIRGQAKVIIGKGGFVDGNIECVQAEVQGEVKGSLVVQDLLFLRGDAKMEGDVLTSHLEMEPSVKFNGKCTMKDKVELPSLSSKEEKPASSSATPLSSKNGNVAKNNGDKEKSSVPGNIFQKQGV